MLIAVPFGEQWSGLESLLLPTEWAVCCSGSVFASEGYSEEVLLDVASHSLGEGCDCRCVWWARWALGEIDNGG